MEFVLPPDEDIDNEGHYIGNDPFFLAQENEQQEHIKEYPTFGGDYPKYERKVMKQFKSTEIVQAEQYFDRKQIDGVLIGKNDPTNRWDDTPDGAYIQSERYKLKVNNGDWIIKRVADKYLYVCSNEVFMKMYTPVTEALDWDEIHESFVGRMKINKDEDTYSHLQRAFKIFKQLMKEKLR